MKRIAKQPTHRLARNVIVCDHNEKKKEFIYIRNEQARQLSFGRLIIIVAIIEKKEYLVFKVITMEK